MSDCCTTIYDLGCLYSCDIISVGVNAADTGVYILEKQPEGIKIVSNTLTAGNAVVFSGGYLNEDGVTIFKVIDPNGDYITGPGGEDCFQVEMKPATDPTLADTNCPACDDATAVLKNTSGTTLSTTTIASGTSSDITAPDVTVTDGITSTSVPSNTSYTCTRFLKGLFNGTDDQLNQITIDADNAATYTSETTDGASGSITYSINGGAFLSLAGHGGSIVLAVADTLDAKRSTFLASGYYKLS